MSPDITAYFLPFFSPAYFPIPRDHRLDTRCETYTQSHICNFSEGIVYGGLNGSQFVSQLQSVIKILPFRKFNTENSLYRCAAVQIARWFFLTRKTTRQEHVRYKNIKYRHLYDKSNIYGIKLVMYVHEIFLVLTNCDHSNLYGVFNQASNPINFLSKSKSKIKSYRLRTKQVNG